MDRLDNLALFVAVAERGGFASAARKFGRSPAAISRAVAELEAQFGQKLFHRTTRALALTEAGEQALPRARALLADYEGLAEGLRGGAEPQGLLTLTAPVMFGRLHIMPIVKQVLRDHRALEVNLLLYDNVVSLIGEGADLGLRIGALPSSSMVAQRVGSVRRMLVAAPDYLAARGTPRAPDDLQGHDLISTLNLSVQPGLWTLGSNEARPLRVHPRFQVNSVDAALDAAISGLGIARLFSYQAEAALTDGRLVGLLQDFEPAPAPIHLVRPAGRPPAKVAAFISAASAVLRSKFAG
jgi:DNA-binding transcriptional LysR family regulator